MTVSLDHLKERFSYNRDTGVLYRKTRGASVVAGTLRTDSYRRVRIGAKAYFAHRLIWAIETGEWPETIDHINGNKSDNRLSNLRPATNAENLRNRGKQANNTTGFKGVYFSKAAGRYVAQIKTNSKMKYLGLFPSPELAHNAYLAAAEILHGEFANGT